VADGFPDGPPKGFEARLVEGDPSESLVAEAGDADLIVVGSRGRGGLKSALLGSVSGHVIHHASCPVVVLKAPSS
jgi:nucleotide-binding universal stress UspA family protein